MVHAPSRPALRLLERCNRTSLKEVKGKGAAQRPDWETGIGMHLHFSIPYFGGKVTAIAKVIGNGTQSVRLDMSRGYQRGGVQAP